MKKIIFISFIVSILSVVLVLSAVHASYKNAIKIAVASDGKTTTASNVSNLAGRSPYFLIFDGSGKLIETVENPYKDARGGAGLSVVNLLAQKGVKTIVADTFGPRMVDAMKDKGIRHLAFKGNVNDAAKKVLGQK
jgi:predicted Fe-Mo cluster-binding NifX family protein